MEVLSALFRRRMLEMLKAAHDADRLRFFGDNAHLADTVAFKAWLAPLREIDWFVYAKRPFAGPEQVLAYLSRYTHRVAISNSRLVSADASSVAFKFKDYRLEGPERYKTMTLQTGEFIRRFLMHVLPKGFHRIRHYGLLARSKTKAAMLTRARELIAAATPAKATPSQKTANGAATTAAEKPAHPCPCCGCRMLIIETFDAGTTPRHRPSVTAILIRVDTS